MSKGRFKVIKYIQDQQRPGDKSFDFESRAILIEIKRHLFQRINHDRQLHRLAPVEYDKIAAQVGEAHCREMLGHKYLSHWNQKGYKPYHRFAFAGGTDSVHENCSSSDASGAVYYSINKVISDVLNSHEAMMAEVPPDDGHRQNILDPAHTHVGIGLAFDSRSIRMSQEFIKRYVSLSTMPPQTLHVHGTFDFRGRLLQAGHTLKSIAVFYEPTPRNMTVAELNRTSSYGLPNAVDYEFPLCPPGMRYSDGSRGHIRMTPHGEFTCPIRFKRGRPGFYTICVWIEDERGQSILATNSTVRVEG
jgi:uncharacterized protein YkwD